MAEVFPWIILFLPLAAAGLITLFTFRNRELSARLSIGAIVTGFWLSGMLLWDAHVTERSVDTVFQWLSVGGLNIDFGLRLDRLSIVMLLVVTGVGGAIHIYSYEYMKGDPGISRYFACLSLFTFSMLGIVLANNFFMLFVFWELVGLSSYLLIGFWYQKPAAAEAGKKAFLVNRVGDAGFLLGILILWETFGSVEYGVIQQKLAQNPNALWTLTTITGLLIFCGAMGKSAQFPLHVWLPDAMEGPTPVSALIHAATMVAAGVYMLCRVFFVFTAAARWPDGLAWLGNISALDVIAWVGGFTALLAALIAVQQNDIKRILAYSTLSQLGYMVMAVGLNGAGAAMYHLTTHASFKALLFLGAGSVIYALHHEQDIWKMGGLREKMPVTFWTFLLATLALAGVPPLSGFFSKDAILAQALHQNKPLYFVAVFVAVLTSFYMFRLVYVAFLGAPRSAAAGHAQESKAVMTQPMLFLAVPTVLLGFWGVSHYLERQFGGPATEPVAWYREVLVPFTEAPLAAFSGLVAVALGWFLAYQVYGNAKKDPLPETLGALAAGMKNRFYFDELYERTVLAGQEGLAKAADAFDRWIVAGLCVGGAHGATELFGRVLRLMQTGNLQTYAFLFVAGVVLVLYWAMGK